ALQAVHQEQRNEDHEQHRRDVDEYGADRGDGAVRLDVLETAVSSGSYDPTQQRRAQAIAGFLAHAAGAVEDALDAFAGLPFAVLDRVRQHPPDRAEDRDTPDAADQGPGDSEIEAGSVHGHHQ